MLFDETKTHSLTGEDLSVLCALINLGSTPKKALKEMRKYNCYRIDVVLLKDEVAKRMKKTNCTSAKILTELVYGTEKSFTRPFFINPNKEIRARTRKK